MIKTELCTKKKREVKLADDANAILEAIEKCKINCPVNGEVVLISDLKKYAKSLRTTK